MYKQKCLDGKTLILGRSVYSSNVKKGFEELAGCRFTDQDDIACARLGIEEDTWEILSEKERNVVVAILANIYLPLITDIDELIDDLRGDCIAIRFQDEQFYPEDELIGIENTFALV